MVEVQKADSPSADADAVRIDAARVSGTELGAQPIARYPPQEPQVLTEKETNFPEPPKDVPIEDTSSRPPCPQCGCTRVFCDGFRSSPTGETIPRYRCAKYGHRFSKHVPRQSFKTQPANIDPSQISVLLQDAKNLTPTQEIKTCAENGKSPTQNEIKAIPQIAKLLTQLQNDGKKPGTVLNYRKSLKHMLTLGADLFDPESTKAALAKSTLRDSTKKTVAAILDVWFEFNAIKWKPPKYNGEHEIPFIPTEELLDIFIAALGKTMATYCQLLKETGARAGEISRLTWDSIDTDQRLVRIKPEKGSNPRILPLTPKAIEMVSNVPKKPDRKEIFSKADNMRTSFFKQRRKVAEKLADPRIQRIHFHTFRHWKATYEQHLTKDPWHVKTMLGHKSMTSTECYIHIEEMMYQNQKDNFAVRVANNLEEAVKLMEVGYEFHVEMDGKKLFRKRK